MICCGLIFTLPPPPHNILLQTALSPSTPPTASCWFSSLPPSIPVQICRHSNSQMAAGSWDIFPWDVQVKGGRGSDPRKDAICPPLSWCLVGRGEFTASPSKVPAQAWQINKNCHPKANSFVSAAHPPSPDPFIAKSSLNHAYSLSYSSAVLY